MAYRPNTKALDRETALLSSPVYAQSRDQLIADLDQLQNASTPQEFFELQRGLIVQARARQQIGDELKRQSNDLAREIATLAKQDPRPLAQIRRAQGLRDNIGDHQFISEALRWLVIAVGDGMAWKALGYDRAAIDILGRGTRVARFAADDGFHPEIEAIAAAFVDGRFAIHNDLTTCLRHGDVTVIDPDSRVVSIGEVKRSEVLGPDSPQIAALEYATTLLNDGEIQTADGLRRVVRAQGPYLTHLPALGQLIERAHAEGYAMEVFDSCLAVSAVDYRALSGEATGEAHTRAWAELGWGEPDIVDWFYGVRRMRDRKHSFSALAPLSLLPFPAHEVADLMMGYTDVAVRLNLRLLADALTERGVTVESPEVADTWFFRAHTKVEDQPVALDVPALLREQLMTELTTIPVFMDAITAMLGEIAAEQEPTEYVVAFTDEQATWAPK